jgi:hypothetical protein
VAKNEVNWHAVRGILIAAGVAFGAVLFVLGIIAFLD